MATAIANIARTILNIVEQSEVLLEPFAILLACLNNAREAFILLRFVLNIAGALLKYCPNSLSYCWNSPKCCWNHH